ncbi:MAG: hypothetical protein E6G94_12215 [Alphaproteobacteria bacterium]|nr:MAG: hypothetical protein E6G94_12215 [Alphaproteobacteria bacterium]
MSTIVIARGGDELAGPSARAVTAGLVLAGSLALIGTGAFWLTSSEQAPLPAPVAAPARVVTAPVTAPAPICVDGKPTSDQVPADSCI